MSKSIDTHRCSPVKRHSKTPSFSSVLLDSIYRSMESDDAEETKHPPATTDLSPPSSDINITRPTHPNPNPNRSQKAAKKDKSVIMIQHWIEKQQEEKEKQPIPTRRNRSAGSCSEADFTSCFTAQKPLMIRTPRSSGSSPSTKIATFFNSIFASSRNKPQRHNFPDSEPRQQNPAASSTSASSCSRSSCLSKSTTPSTCSSSSGKRSVRFYPLSVIVGEDSRPCGHKCLYDPDPLPSIKPAKLTKIPNVGRSNPWYLPDTVHDLHMKTDEDDAESDASSDLFELESIGPIGGRSQYDQDLPVYGTTSFEMNKAIANGLLI